MKKYVVQHIFKFHRTRRDITFHTQQVEKHLK